MINSMNTMKCYSNEKPSSNLKVMNDTDLNTIWNRLKNIITTCLDEIAPKITKRIRGQPSPWLSVELKVHMNTRNILLRKSRKSKNTADIAAYKKKRNQVNRLVKFAKKEYFKDLLDTASHNSNSF